MTETCLTPTRSCGYYKRPCNRHNVAPNLGLVVVVIFWLWIIRRIVYEPFSIRAFVYFIAYQSEISADPKVRKTGIYLIIYNLSVYIVYIYSYKPLVVSGANSLLWNHNLAVSRHAVFSWYSVPTPLAYIGRRRPELPEIDRFHARHWTHHNGAEWRNILKRNEPQWIIPSAGSFSSCVSCAQHWGCSGMCAQRSRSLCVHESLAACASRSGGAGLTIRTPRVGWENQTDLKSSWRKTSAQCTA